MIMETLPFCGSEGAARASAASGDQRGRDGRREYSTCVGDHDYVSSFNDKSLSKKHIVAPLLPAPTLHRDAR
jgi:hypothetical protein